MHECLEHVRHRLGRVVLESRMDGAFFEKTLLESLDRCGVQFTCSVPFARFAELKGLIEERRFWRRLDRDLSYFESAWKPKFWDRTFRFIFIRHKVKNQQKGPLQLDLFEPLDYRYEYTVIVANRKERTKKVVLFHHGRGGQEALFGEAKQDVAFQTVPTKRRTGNQVLTLWTMMAHNLSRELQMRAKTRRRRLDPKRGAAWSFEALNTLRRRFIQRAGRLIRPQGKLTLSMAPNQKVQQDIVQYLSALQQAA
jgi:hypothetical protein